MSRSTFIIGAAFFIIFMPYMGFPRDWEPAVLLALGGFIIMLELYAVLIRARDSFFNGYEIQTDVYAERIQGRVTPKTRHEGRDPEKNTAANADVTEDEETLNQRTQE